jgi:hypothetical protein
LTTLNKYRLSAEENRVLFDKTIVPAEFPILVSQSQPVVVFVGGQPGAGKTALQERIEYLNVLPDLTKINGDDYRAYHPDYNRLLYEDDTIAATYTDLDVGSWIELSINIVRLSAANALVEGTLCNPAVTIKSAQLFKDSGYLAELHVMAAHRFHSKLRVFNRYLSQREEHGFGRYTLMSAHDASYDVLPRSINTIIESGLFSRVVLYTIERDVLFDSLSYGNSKATVISDLIHFVRNEFHGSIECLLVDINTAYRKAVELGCNDLVLHDIKSLNAEVLSCIETARSIES